MNSYAKWFSRVVWLGILSNFALALPTLFMPDQMLALFSLPSASPTMWPSFAALLLILLSLFYIPAALRPVHYPLVSWLTVLARLAGVIFFCIFNRDYMMFGLFDLVFLVPEGILLTLAIREAKKAPQVATAGRTVADATLGMTTAPADHGKWKMRLTAAATVLVLLIAGVTYYEFFRELPPPHFASDEEHFLYGSIGTEGTAGVPYWIWLVLPRVFPDKLPYPGGYESLGIVAQEGRELPVGFSKQTIGIERVSINCAFCHTTTYRKNPGEKPVIVPAGPSNTTSPQGYLRFLFACASDPRFTSSTIMAEIARNHRLSLLDRLTYRFALIPFTKITLRQQQNQYQQYGWMKNNPPWGNGRIDPFNPVKYRVLNQPVDGSIGNSDMVPLWNLGAHHGYSFHWDGLNTNLHEVVISSAIGDGTPPRWVDRDWSKSSSESSLKRIENYISHAQPTKFPFPINAALAARGNIIYNQQCAECHAIGGARTGKVEPIDNPMLETDRHRIDMWTQNAATAYNNYGAGHFWKLTHFVKQNGYVNVPLEGLWLRGPYLHNGSVPTLTDLLEDPGHRPKFFYRGYDVLDPQKVGFVSEGAEAERVGFRYDTSVPGNSNRGHLWGTTLSGDDKKAMIEYLKTL
ncbi:MAG: cytochrome c [Bryobacteraceae bacterium]